MAPELPRERAGQRRDVRVRIRPDAVPVVVRDERPVEPGEAVEVVDERVAAHIVRTAEAVRHQMQLSYGRMALPPAFAAGALYDNLLQAALRQFFARATFESEPTPSISSDGRLAIEPTNDPAELTVRWFGSRHILRVPPWRPFTEHEVRLARSIGAVLATRYRAIFDPSVMALRGDLFRGAIEDRYIGTFLDGGQYALQGEEGRADRLSDAIEVLRVAALSSYENRAISSGVLHLEGRRDPVNPDRDVPAGAYAYNQSLTAIKSFYRLCDGLNTLFLVNRDGVVLDIVEVQRWASERGRRALEVPCAVPYRAHAGATLDGGEACIVLSPSHEIKVFAEGAQVFTFRNAQWHLLDLEAKYTLWQNAVGKPALARRLFQTALDLSDAREGALFVILRDPRSRHHAAGRAVRIASTPWPSPWMPGRRHPGATSCTCWPAAWPPRSIARSWKRSRRWMARPSWTLRAPSSRWARS